MRFFFIASIPDQTKKPPSGDFSLKCYIGSNNIDILYSCCDKVAICLYY